MSSASVVFPRPGGPKKRVWSRGSRLARAAFYIDAQRFLDPVLTDELGQALGAERELDYALVGDDFGGGDFSSGHANEFTEFSYLTP